MKKRKRLIILLGIAIVFAVIVGVAAFRYVPWHKFIKVPTSDELAFTNKNPRKNDIPNSLRFDFEVDSTESTPGGIYKGEARSGNYSAKAFGKNSFTVNVVQRAGDIGLENLNGVAVSAWIYIFPSDNEVTGSLVFSANNSVGTNICWKGCGLSGPLVPRGTWFKMSRYFDLSEVRLRDDDQIQFYFWNNSDTEILVDDLFCVFGAPRERKGDSSRVDMTVESGYVAEFNVPPFRTSLLLKQDIGNQDKMFLGMKGERSYGEILPTDQVISGNFITGRGDLQSMLVFGSEGQPALYHFCKSAGRFEEVSLEADPALHTALNGFAWMKGKFLPGKSDQLLVTGQHGMLLLGFDLLSPPCSKEGAAAKMKVLWSSETPGLDGIPLQNGHQMTSGDLTGNGLDELLLFEKNGSWKLFQFVPSGPSSGDWKTLATGEEYKLREWNQSLVDFNASTGRYIAGSATDLVLTRFRDLKTGRDAYTLQRFVPGDKKFVKIFSDSQGSIGLTIGIDTLKLTDQIIPGNFFPGNRNSFLRYNRDWRYDLKDIIFNDSTFRILSAVDFTGNPADRNPKFYEILKLHAGNWLDPDVTSVLAIARNCKDPAFNGKDCSEYEEIPGLPSTLQLYTFTTKKP